MPGPYGIKVKNRIYITIEPVEGITFDNHIQNFIDLLQFIEIIAGRPQNILDLKITDNPKEEEDSPDLTVHWPMQPRRRESFAHRQLHPGDSLINPAKNPDEFEHILRSWCKQFPQRRSSYHRYSESFRKQNSYSIDRIIATANMFDILPKGAIPNSVPLSNDLACACERAKSDFQNLPDSPEKQSVLSVLGRVGKPNLKRKIRHRVQIIQSAVGDSFEELEFVTDEAVNCRNYYVHGGRMSIDYEEHDYLLNLFVDTLEFVFAASELIECGWNIREWMNKGTSTSHPFGIFKIGYKHGLKTLKDAKRQS